MQIYIEGVEKTSYIKKGSLQIQNVLTKQVDTCSFTIINYGSKVYVPSNEDEVVIYDGADKIFGGVVVNINEEMNDVKLFEYKISCTDYTRLADRKLVSRSYTSETVEDIIDDIITKYLPTFTATNVVCTTVIDSIAFDYEPFSKCLQRLADITGYDWYIDYDKDVHFFDKTTNTSPFNLTDTNGNYIIRSLKIKRDTSQLRNLVYVRGGDYLADTMTAEFVADGEQIIFFTPHKFSDIHVTVTGAARTVGIDYADDPDSYDCLYNFNDKSIKFKDADKPSLNALVTIAGVPNIPILIERRDETSIATYGEFHYRIIDKRIKSKDEARARGLAEITSYGDRLSEGTFRTHQSGLRSGQYINIQSDIRGLDEDFVINRVTMRERDLEDFWYDISIVTTKTFGVIEFLQKLLAQPGESFEVPQEIIDRLWSFSSETFPSFASTISAEYITGPWYAGGPASTKSPIGYASFCQSS